MKQQKKKNPESPNISFHQNVFQVLFCFPPQWKTKENLASFVLGDSYALYKKSAQIPFSKAHSNSTPIATLFHISVILPPVCLNEGDHNHFRVRYKQAVEYTISCFHAC